MNTYNEAADAAEEAIAKACTAMSAAYTAIKAARDASHRYDTAWSEARNTAWTDAAQTVSMAWQATEATHLHVIDATSYRIDEGAQS